jgi:hypothetical protein
LPVDLSQQRIQQCLLQGTESPNSAVVRYAFAQAQVDEAPEHQVPAMAANIVILAIIGPTLEIQSLGVDQVLGWSWLISPYKWNFQAEVAEDSELLMFDGVAILLHCENEPKFGYDLLKKFAELMSIRLDAARRKMMDEWNPPGFA